VAVDQSDREGVERAQAAQRAVEAEDHPVELLGSVVVDRDACGEGALTGAAYDHDLKVGLPLELGEAGIELGQEREVEDVERRLVDGQRRRPLRTRDLDRARHVVASLRICVQTPLGAALSSPVRSAPRSPSRPRPQRVATPRRCSRRAMP